MDKQKNTAAEVLKRVEEYIAKLGAPGSFRRLKITDVYAELSIFDWWPEYLSKSKLQEMRQFLKEAIKLGYEGYVCFKVGATGCANGMWAFTELETDDGYSPDGCPTLFRSFTPAYLYWDVTDRDGHFNWLKGKEYDSLKTIRELEAFIEEHPQDVYSKQNDDRIEREVDIIEKVLGL